MMSEPNLKVLLLASRFEVRGSCAYTVRLAEGLGAVGVDARIACSSAETVPRVKRRTLPIREFPRLELPLLSRLSAYELARELQKDPPDLIHVQTRKVLAVGNWLCEVLKLPSVLTVHDFLRPLERLRLSTRWTRRIIAVSDAVKADLVQNAGVPEDLVNVMPSGVEVQPVFPRRERSERHVPVVGTAGPLEPIKGHPFFLHAAGLVLNQGLDVEFLIAGAGPEEPNLRRLARQLGISEHVTFVPYVREYTEVLEAMDVFCLPSLQQGLGTVMLEAMALGKPVVASGVGGVYTVVHNGQTGLLIPRRNAAALAEKIVQLLRAPELARRMGENARKLVARQFSVNRMVDGTARVYREVVESGVAAAAR